MFDFELLKTLCMTNGVSGDEDRVRDIILSEIRPFADSIDVDSMGNIIAFKKGKKQPEKKLLISAHMDEVGFIVTHITEEGLLKFDCVGGVNDSAAFARYVRIGKNNIPGVVCSAPLHLLKKDERRKNPPISSLYIDIGAKDRQDAEKYVSLGDTAAFDAPFDCCEGRVISKAIDDRFGCMVLIEMLRSELEYDMYFSFVVQEEVGLRGAKAAAFSVDPDFAIVVEATTAGDVPFAEDEKRVCVVDGGAVVTFMDRATIYDRELFALVNACARAEGIRVQTKTMIAGGNDAGAIHSSRGGVRTVAISLPCRYIHSSSGLAYVTDMDAVLSLVRSSARTILTEC